MRIGGIILSIPKTALVILPEIYGCNAFAVGVQEKYRQMGMAVFCPNLWLRPPFGYSELSSAYAYFQRNIGFQVYRDIDYLLEELQAAYDRVLILGFSVGGTLAWRCSALGHADGVIACYGSRIRDYPEVEPVCPTLLLFAEHDSFPVMALIRQMKGKKCVRTLVLPAEHGFLDAEGPNYCRQQAEEGWRQIEAFMMQIVSK
jgi:dienelactone hydrolase